MQAVQAECATSATRETVTIEAALSAGCREDDTRWDLKRGFLTIHDPAIDLPTVAPGPLSSDAGGIINEE